MLRYDHLWNWKDCLMRIGFSFLFNSVHLLTVPLSFTLLTADYTYEASGPSWSHLVENEIKLLAHQRLSSQEPGNSITYSPVNSVLLLKTPGGSSFIWLLPNSLRKNIPWFQLKVSFFRNCCYCRFLFYFFCWINSLFMSCPDQTSALL